MIDRLIQTLKRDEGAVKIGDRHKVYRDSLNLETIGYGRLLSRGLSDEEAEHLLENDVREAERLADRFPWFSNLDEVRQDVVTMMCFNLGYERLLGFHNLLAALSRSDWITASNEMLDSRWAVQVGVRANRLANIMRSGKWE
jgi:lysozyme